MPVDWSRYPPAWATEVVPRIRARSGNRCEWCGLANGAYGYRDKGGGFHPLDGSHAQEVRAAEEGWRTCKIVLTTAHLGAPHADGRPGDKHDKMDCRDENLAHLCQRCHLLYDLPEHVANARKTRNRKKGQVDMFEEDA
jgi:hypothetical protein